MRTLLALSSAVAALLLTLVLLPYIPHSRYALFFGSVVFAAWIARPAVAAATLALVLLLAEVFVFGGSGGALLVMARNVALSLVGGAFIVLVHRMHETNQRLVRQMDVSSRAAVRADRLQHMLGLLLNRVTPVSVAGVIVDEGRATVDASAAAVVVRTDTDGHEILAAHGYTPEMLRAGAAIMTDASPMGDVLRTGEAVWVPTRAEAERRYPLMRGAARTQSRAWAALPLRIDNRLLGALGFSFDTEGEFPADDRAFMLLLAQQCAQALDRARLHQLELAARVRAEFAERRLSLLSEASAELGASLDFRATLERVAWLAVPEIADWCVIHLVDESGEPRIVAMAHADPQRLEARRELEKRYPSSRTSGAPYAGVLANGEPVHIPRLSEEDVRRSARNEEHFAALRLLGLASQIAVPITADDMVIGVLSIAHAESGRNFTESDVTLAVEIGRRAGLAVHNSRLYADAQRASDTKSDFLAVISHELRTPLNAIIGYSDLLLLGVPEPVNPRAQKQVERIRGASTSLLHLVEEILSFSRIEAGKEELRISPLDIAALVADCVAMVEPLASEKNLSARLDIPAERVMVVSDERKIRQIVTNLLSNAVKFTEAGGFTVSVRAEPGSIHVTVADTGVGIPAELLEKIFEPFWQVDATATRRFGGTGLGLGVARKLANLLEGQLTVQSEPGSGSTFELTLPTRTPGMSR